MSWKNSLLKHRHKDAINHGEIIHSKRHQYFPMDYKGLWMDKPLIRRRSGGGDGGEVVGDDGVDDRSSGDVLAPPEGWGRA